VGKLRIVQVGLGPLGQRLVRYACQRPAFEIVAAVDSDPAKIGRDAGELSGARRLGVIVSGSIDQAPGSKGADVAVLATVSGITVISSQVEALAAIGLPVVTTCEELSWPWETAPSFARRIDAAARAAGVAVLATGVNPGFLMDCLPIALTAVCQSVRHIGVTRIQDASSRRLPFQLKIGAGLTLKAFEEKKTAGTLRHVGLTESMQMIASRMGWKLERVQDVVSPIVARERIATASMTVEPGCAAGVQQIGRGFCDGEERITLVFRAAIGEPGARDAVEILGEPTIHSTIPGGVNGDVATCGITLNAIRQVVSAAPGLRTMADIPLVSWFS
jgi:2,4-diaminopentanoate dehydrogenase